MRIKDVWDKYWKEKEATDIKEILKNDPYYRLLKRLIRLNKDKKLILEVGCGSGVRTLALQGFEDHLFDSILVDISLSAILLAKNNARKNNIESCFILADAFYLPFRKAFDVVWNEGVNEHFDGNKRQKFSRNVSCV